MEIEKKHAQLGKYQVTKTLGTGYTSKIKLGYDPETEQHHALKILKKNCTFADDKTLRAEVSILSKLSHKNIIKIFEVQENADYIKRDGSVKKVTYMALELADGGELFDYVANTGVYSEPVARYYFRQLIEALEYCHNSGIAHRDLKPENLLYDKNFELKIADFGFSTALAGRDGKGKLYTYLGTEAYMAPEIHLKMAYNGTAVDLFAAGIILFIMYSGSPAFGRAFPSDPYYKLLCTNKHKTFWAAHSRNKPGRGKYYSQEFRSLLNAMLAFDPTQRPSLAEIKEHPWFKGPAPTKEEIETEFRARHDKVKAKHEKER